MWSLPSVKQGKILWVTTYRGQPFIYSYVTRTWEKNQISYLVPLKQTTEESLLFYTLRFMQTTQSWVQRCRRCHAGYLLCVVVLKKRNVGLHTVDFGNVLWCFLIWPVLSCFWGPVLHISNVRSCLKKKNLHTFVRQISTANHDSHLLCYSLEVSVDHLLVM